MDRKRKGQIRRVWTWIETEEHKRKEEIRKKSKEKWTRTKRKEWKTKEQVERGDEKLEEKGKRQPQIKGGKEWFGSIYLLDQK